MGDDQPAHNDQHGVGQSDKSDQEGFWKGFEDEKFDYEIQAGNSEKRQDVNKPDLNGMYHQQPQDNKQYGMKLNPMAPEFHTNQHGNEWQVPQQELNAGHQEFITNGQSPDIQQQEIDTQHQFNNSETPALITNHSSMPYNGTHTYNNYSHQEESHQNHGQQSQSYNFQNQPDEQQLQQDKWDEWGGFDNSQPESFIATEARSQENMVMHQQFEKQQQEEIERQRLLDIENERMAAIELQRLEDVEAYRLEQIERKRLEATEKERHEEVERERHEEVERQRLEEVERQGLEEMERQRLEEMERQRLEEIERQRLEEIERQRLEEIERQRYEEVERERH